MRSVFTRSIYGLLFAAVVFALTFPAPVMAQQLPPSVEPGVIQKQLEQPELPKAAPPIDIPDIGQSTPPPGAGEVRFVLTDLLVIDSTVYTEEELRPIWEGLLNQEITLTQFYEIAAAITIKYRNDGYILSRALVPPQEIIDGIAEIEVIEGYIDNVVIEGEPSGPMSQIDDKVQAILDSQPLHSDVLERNLLLLNDLPGVIAQSILRPSITTPGASELVIVLEESTFSGAASVNNRGSRFLGPYQAGLSVRADNLLGLYESTELEVVGTAQISELKFAALTHTQQLNSDGTTLTVIGSLTDTEPGSTLDVLNIEGRSEAVTLTVSHPMIRSRRQNLSLVGGFDYRNSETKILGVTSSEDRIRSVFVGGTYDFIDEFRGITLLGAELRQGIDILDATETGSDNLSRANGRSDYTKLVASVRRKQTLAPGWSLSAAVTGQYAFSQLLASEECGLGGEEYGSAYDPFEISGDHCLAARFELQYGDASELEYIDSFELYGFTDVGAVWQIDNNDRDNRQSLASIGVGARANLIEDFWGSLEFAVPMTRSPTVDRDDGDKKPRLFFSIIKRF
ncbi:ShlB/FhaC/HecB family hemolysin secretion/activation protein [Pelagibius sp. Alg239-R121]|uniref:ShlB/FhaC/HecB family hemolysin secretion/activation protein n=1 Tax=Pelagibius sp. Alg239-R121 TaxID=2993448 RepID=UPI0024A70528|nr:ShlB/FhaC/HecB family hemolysin secretion/activation protein [Pelagibius sp. Alg239-R121]